MATKKNVKIAQEEPEQKKKGKSSVQRLYRSETNAVIGGVAGGLGEYFNIDPTIIRILFVVLGVSGGSGIILYIALWVIIPSQSNLTGDLGKNIDDVKDRAQSIGKSMESGVKGESNKSWIALILILFGGLFLLNNYGLANFDLWRMWPLWLIVLGLFLIFKRK